MTAEKFYQLINHPLQVDTAAIEQLKDVIEQFPYFQSARLLYIKGLHNGKNFLYNDELKKTAVYAADRKLLFTLINSEATPSYENADQSSTDTPASYSDNEGLQISVTETVSEIIINNDPIIEDSEVEDAHESEIKLPEEKYPETEEEKPISSHAKPSLEEILAQRLSEISSKNEVSFDEDNRYETIDTPEKEINSIAPPSEEKINVIADNSVESELKNSVPDTPSEVHSFTDWLNKFTKSELSPEEKFRLPKADIAEKRIETFHLSGDSEEKKTPVNFDSPSFAETEINISKPSAATSDLIDRFIKAEPRIEPGKTKFYSPANVAKNSILDQSDLVSETLANIYYTQGNLSKAIQTYEKLSLRYPEKNAFFAARISEIRNKMRDDG